jgi:hypothetical protein
VKQGFTTEDINEQFNAKAPGYFIKEYGGHKQRKQEIFYKDVDGNIHSGFSAIADILNNRNPTWSPICKKRHHLTTEMINQEFKAKAPGYFIKKYSGKINEKQEVFYEDENGNVTSGYVIIKTLFNGYHPSWSPICKNRKNFTTEEINERLDNDNPGYFIKKYEGNYSRPQEVFYKDEDGNITSGKVALSSLFNGQNAGWSPKCRYRLNLTKEDLNEEIKIKMPGYYIEDYAGQRTAVQEIFYKDKEGNITSGISRLWHLLNGIHPSWNFPSSICNPSDDKEGMLYLTKVQHADTGRMFLKPGITVRSIEQRYRGTGYKVCHIYHKLMLENNVCKKERLVLRSLNKIIGPPDHGAEFWLYSEQREKIVLDIYKKIIKEVAMPLTDILE